MEPTELPPPVFDKLPRVEEVIPTATAGTYRVVLREPGGEAKSALFTVDEGGPLGPSVTATDWDIFWRWPGDAESVRSVIRQVTELHSRSRE